MFMPETISTWPILGLSRMDLQIFGPTCMELPKDIIHQDGFELLVHRS